VSQIAGVRVAVLTVSDRVSEGSRQDAGGAALCDLVEQAGAEVAGCAFIVELAFLAGRERLAPHDVYSLIVYEDE
jgi:adenine phosphoribosyltransferase